MNIKTLIKHLQLLKNDYGDELEVVLSSDSEGNSYSTIDKFSICTVFENEDNFIDSMRLGDDKEKEKFKNFFNKAKRIGVCIYPFEENYASAEAAVKLKRG